MSVVADERGQVLEAFAKVLRRESHNLRERPELLWQQMYNRLQWEEEPVSRLLELERHSRSAPGSAPLLWTKTRLRESETLRFTLSHRSPVVINPDARFIVSGSLDGTCKIWDPATGTKLDHTDRFEAVNFRDAGEFINLIAGRAGRPGRVLRRNRSGEGKGGFGDRGAGSRERCCLRFPSPGIRE